MRERLAQQPRLAIEREVAEADGHEAAIRELPGDCC
jgi:hypothetical protein